MPYSSIINRSTSIIWSVVTDGTCLILGLLFFRSAPERVRPAQRSPLLGSVPVHVPEKGALPIIRFPQNRRMMLITVDTISDRRHFGVPARKR